jgi:threonine dehydrogenase-like Zn-dependent dehydrogenase
MGLSLGEEFHHNRINVISSQIFGVSLALDHRWTVERLERTVMTLAAEEKIGLKPLVTHVFEVDEADEAFRLLDENPGEAVQVVLEF